MGVGDQIIPEASSCKYFGMNLHSDVSWSVQANYTPQTAWKALPLIIRVLKKGNCNTKSLAHKSLAGQVLENGASCQDPYRECQIKAVDRVQR